MTEDKTDIMRYTRLAALPDIGPEGVARLSDARVLTIGCGALGSLCAMYLAASGVGHVAIADFDTIDISNLQRQLFFSEGQLGQSKADVLAGRIKALNSSVTVETIGRMVKEKDAGSLFRDYDIIVDGSDNPSTKLMTDRVCEKLCRPCVIAGVREFDGQVMTCLPDSARYREVFGEEACGSGFTPCSAGGVLGPASGVAASIQSAEVIKFITGAGTLLTDRFLSFSLLDMNFQVFSLTPPTTTAS